MDGACVRVSVKVRPIDKRTRIALAFTTKTIRAQYTFKHILRYFADAQFEDATGWHSVAVAANKDYLKTYLSFFSGDLASF